MSNRTVLLIDDDQNILTVLQLRLRAGGWQVITASDAESALRARAGHDVDVVICDLRLGSENGLDVMDRLHASDATLPVLMLTAHGSIPNAVEALNRGAAGYLTKPVDREELFAQLGRALQSRRMAREVDALRRAIEDRGELGGLIGQSAGMRRVFELIEQHAALRHPVLVLGETGAGRASVARALHQLSPRANRPFLVIDGASLQSADLSPTGRTHQTLLRAQSGTVAVTHAERLAGVTLRALVPIVREQSLTPLGSLTPNRLDLRWVFCANPSGSSTLAPELSALAEEAVIHLPPLRDREGDAELIAERFLARQGAGAALSPDARAALRRHRWPQNVAELQQRLEQGLAASDGGLLGAQHLFPEAWTGAPTG